MSNERECRPKPVAQYPYFPCNSDFSKLTLAIRILCANSYYSPALGLNTSHRVLRTLTLFYCRFITEINRGQKKGGGGTAKC